MTSKLPDWKDDEAVVRWAVPEGCMVRTFGGKPVRYFIASGPVFLCDNMNSSIEAWARARQHPTVREKELLHNPAFATPHTAGTPEMPAAVEADFQQRDWNEGNRYIDAFIEAVNADHSDVISVGRDGACMMRDVIEQMRRAQPAVPASRESSSAEGLESELRRLMWLSHGHQMGYGDDGEMQCVECSQYGCWDYKNAPLSEVRAAYKSALLERLAKQLAAQPAPAHHDVAQGLADGEIPYRVNVAHERIMRWVRKPHLRREKESILNELLDVWEHHEMPVPATYKSLAAHRKAVGL